MGVIHGLECDTGVIAVEVAVLDKVFDSIDDLGEDSSVLGCLNVKTAGGNLF